MQTEDSIHHASDPNPKQEVHNLYVPLLFLLGFSTSAFAFGRADLCTLCNAVASAGSMAQTLSSACAACCASKLCMLCCAGLGWAGLGWAGLGWAGTPCPACTSEVQLLLLLVPSRITNPLLSALIRSLHPGRPGKLMEKKRSMMNTQHRANSAR